MEETPADLQRLSTLLAASHGHAGAHLQRTFQEPMSAKDLVAALDGIFEMHVATATPSGAPFVAPIDGLFYRGWIFFGVPSRAVRAQFLRQEPRISASYTSGSFCFIVHGVVHAVPADDPLRAGYDAYSASEYVKQYGEAWREWAARQRESEGAGDLWRIEPRRLFAKPWTAY